MDTEPSAYHFVSIALRIAASLLLVALNGFFVTAEFAIVKVRRTRLEELAGKGVRAAKLSILCVDELDEYLSTTQLGITLVSLALGWIGEQAFADLLLFFAPNFFEHAPVGYHIVASILAFFTITMLHVVLGELVPKSMAIQNAEKITLFIAKPLQLFRRFLKPLIFLFTAIANAILRRIGYATRGWKSPL